MATICEVTYSEGFSVWLQPPGGLIDLDHVDVVDRQSGALECPAGRGDRAHTNYFWRDASNRNGADAAEHVKVMELRIGVRRDKRC